MKKVVSLVLAICLMACSMVACTPKTETKKTAAFVTFSTDGEFFSALAKTFETEFAKAGWDTKVTDGQFNPAKQVEACENYIAMKVDILYIWAVAQEAVTGVIKQAMNAGIKVVAFVQPLDDYDALMVSDNTKLAQDTAKLAIKWLEANYKDATEPVEVAVYTERDAETGVVQGDALLKIQDFTSIPLKVVEVPCKAENAEEGQAVTENFYTTNPNTKLYITAHNAIGKGINAFLTSQSSPVTDYTGLGIFVINGDDATAELIQSEKSPFRGMTLTGSVADTVGEMIMVANGIFDGSMKKGYVQQAGTVFVDEAHAAEYLETGKSTLTIE